MLADGELQEAVFQRLGQDSKLALIMGAPAARVFDYVPENTPFPYIQYQLVQSVEDGTTTTDGFACVYQIHVWSTYEGTKESHDIMQRVYELLHQQYDFSLQMYRMINQRYEFSELMRDPDGQTYHGVMRFRAVLDSIATEAS